ncbi:MAG: hypothetical protein F9K40_08815 [Kofleriaceae bacterium]|nr:MAG: hypothetical protein F9K40_08815 [Kofleriaceae bacterium]
MLPILTAGAISKLTRMLELPASGAEQDWELELCDAARIDEFVRLYETGELDDEDRRALMSLIVASADDALGAGGTIPAQQARIAALLVRDAHLHLALLDYWSQGEIDEPEAQFLISPWIREVRRGVPEPFCEAIKDSEREHPVATAWRPALRSIVSAFVRGDYELAEVDPRVDPVSVETSAQMRAYAAEYGETLVELPRDTWSTSIASWTGTDWHVLVDLWTREGGRSDMVLDVRVRESQDGFRIAIHLVYVP